MDRETGSGGSHRDRRPAGDGGAPDRLGELRGRLAGRAARLRDRARQRWRERTEPGPLGDPPPAVWEGATPPGDSPATGGHPRQGSLRSRLLWSFVGVAALAALIVGIVTLSLVRLASVNGLEQQLRDQAAADRKSTRLNSSHPSISYAVFCLKKKKKTIKHLIEKKKKKKKKQKK